jgi:hypothetical protein
LSSVHKKRSGSGQAGFGARRPLRPTREGIEFPSHEENVADHLAFGQRSIWTEQLANAR